ncbi:hypothetical protein LCGC14_0739970 [marine sediment metagenome]|uniref:Uncharacterized protein n=1 Tax=marine sediment metagenome TaxID=412755 RepID=A0A0F9SS02_9ZZZZ
MSKFYVSFGQIHAHRIGTVTFDCDSLLELEANSMAEVRAKVFESQIKDKFFTIYDEDNVDFNYFPRGAISAII